MNSYEANHVLGALQLAKQIVNVSNDRTDPAFSTINYNAKLIVNKLSSINPGPCTDNAKKYTKEQDRRDNSIISREDLENMLFARGAMNKAPCFCCGYNGPNYFQSDTHPCAARHHSLYEPFKEFS